MRLVAGRHVADRRPLTAAGAGDAASAGHPTAGGADVLDNGRLQNDRVGRSVLRHRRRTDSPADAERPERDAVVMLVLMGAFHVHLEPNSTGFPLSVVTRTGLHSTQTAAEKPSKCSNKTDRFYTAVNELVLSRSIHIATSIDLRSNVRLDTK